jgi:hypothetical protein
MACTWLMFTSILPSLALEAWVKTNKLGSLRGFAWAIFAISGVGLLSIGTMELAILKGWEPKWLRRFVPGCLVIEIYKNGSDPKEHRRIEIQAPSGWANWYILDSDEVGLCSVGDTIHLWAIGKHVAHLMVVDKSQIVYPPKTRIVPWSRIWEMKQDGCAWIVMWLAPLFSGGLFGKGVEHLLFQEVHWTSGRRYNRIAHIATGSPALWAGGTLALLGVGLAVCAFYYWLQGWDDSSINSDNLIEAAFVPSRRYWWW